MVSTPIDLSHTIEEGMVTYRGLPAPLICDFLSREASRQIYAPGTEFQIGRIEMVGNTGTYLDSPFHRYADGKDLSQLPLESLAGLEGVVVRCAPGAITRANFEGLDLQGKAVLVQTDWDRNWRTDAYFEGHPFLTEDAALFLRESGAKLVGIDSYNIDDIHDGRRPVHTILLGSEIPIVEHLTGLGQLPDRGFQFFAVPPKVKAFGTFPVRAFALTENRVPLPASSSPVRAMIPDDLPAALALWKDTEGIGLNLDETPPLLTQFLARNPGMSGVAVNPDGTLVGAVLGGYDGRRAYLYHLAVCPEFRGRGLARALTDHVLSALKAAGMSKCTIVVYAANAAGSAFWRHLGWSLRADLAIYQVPL